MRSEKEDYDIVLNCAKRELHRGALINVEGVLELEDYLKRDGWTRDKRLKVLSLIHIYLRYRRSQAVL